MTMKEKELTMTRYEGLNKVTDWIWVGGDPLYVHDLDAAVSLLNRDFDLVIDARSHAERRDGWNELSGLEVPVLHVPLHDDGVHDNNWEQFVDFKVEKDNLYPGAKKVFVHCHMGVNRGPSVAMFLLMLEHKMSAEDAFMALRDNRPGVGVAYAGMAVEAAETLLGGNEYQVDDARQDWEAFEDQYWTGVRTQTVKDRINANRYGHQNVWTDDYGVDHVTKGE